MLFLLYKVLFNTILYKCLTYGAILYTISELSFKMICVSEPTTLNFGIPLVQEGEVVFSKDTPPISQLVT